MRAGNVFVLSTGRCGSTTFARASAHLTNYTAGHETKAGGYGAARMDYPPGHVEVDNRLSWMLGHLDAAYGDAATYVHLRRDRDATARSYVRRWDSGWRGGIITAFAHGILMQPDDFPAEERLDVCRYYVDTVNANITSFLATKSHVFTVDLESACSDFFRVWDAIGGTGDRAAARSEWEFRHNASR